MPAPVRDPYPSEGLDVAIEALGDLKRASRNHRPFAVYRRSCPSCGAPVIQDNCRYCGRTFTTDG